MTIFEYDPNSSVAGDYFLIVEEILNMASEKQFVDPLEDIDPVMEDAFSSFEESNNFSAGAAAVSKAFADSQPKKMAVSHVEFPDLDDANEGKNLKKVYLVIFQYRFR